jgi:predicted MFS family arabinose efflux permease
MQQLSERKLLTVLAAVQFVNVLEFMIVLPLGPDFAEALDIPLAHLGWVGAAYTFSAAIAGLLSAAVLDRFCRRQALTFALSGLMLATLSAAAAPSFAVLLCARVAAGAFGGPATALGYAIIADVIPSERRGRAMGVVLGAFSVSSVVGVPLGLELSRLAGFRAPFLAIALLTALVTALARFSLPSLTSHIGSRRLDHGAAALGAFLGRRAVACSLLATSFTMMGMFALIPNLSAYFQFNLGYPRERLGLLYLVGGVTSFVAMRIGGNLVDRYGAPLVVLGGTLVLTADLVAGFIAYRPFVPAVAIFVGLMLANSVRAVAVTSLSTRVPLPDERARFLSLQSAVQHGSSAVGALISTAFLTEGAGHQLLGMPSLAVFTLASVALVPFLTLLVATDLRRREAAPSPASGESSGE